MFNDLMNVQNVGKMNAGLQNTYSPMGRSPQQGINGNGMLDFLGTMGSAPQKAKPAGPQFQIPNWQGGMFNFPGLDLSQYKEFNQDGKGKSVGDPMNMSKLLSQGFMPLLLQQLGQAYKNEPRRQGMLEEGLRALDPARRKSLADRFRRQVGSAARDSAMRQQAQLGAQGMSDAMKQGLMLDSENRATTSANDYEAQLYSPESDLQSAMGRMQLLDSSQFGALQPFLQLAAAGQPPPQPDKPTFFETLLGAASSALPFFRK
jgi:hypothetical protein